VALIGRGHPAGIVVAAILFGALYQGGTEVSFQMPDITRDMIVIIQGLVILFAGALEHMFRPQIQTLFASLSPRSVGLAAAKSGERDMEFADALVQVITSTIRLSTPLLLACLAGLYSSAPAFSTSVWKARCWLAHSPARPPPRCWVQVG
jgi:hypothetical protein